jgi:hypothetical protein
VLVVVVVATVGIATMIALMVCSRFSAWSNAMFEADSKTSLVTSRPFSMPVDAATSLPTLVLVSWNAGRQCMNFASRCRSSPVLPG